MFVAIDLGNTALKLGAFEGDRLVAVERIDARRSLEEDVIPPAHLIVADHAAAISSSPGRTSALLAWSPRPIRVLGDECRSVLRTSYARPSELGLDRIAAAVAARELTGARSVAVASIGTAVTVDALGRDGVLTALAVAPGLRAAADGLHAAAPHLPLPSLGPGEVRRPARGTDDAVRAGHVLGFAGLVDRLLDEAAQAAAGVDAVVLTGGDAEVLSSHLRTSHRVEPHAVLHGVRWLAERVPA